MAAEFDPYHRWLGISPKDQPPNYYRLLSVDLFEDDPEVIRDAADRQMAHVRTYQLGECSELSQRILNELGAARACLLDKAAKVAYDRGLREAAAPVVTPVAVVLPAVPRPLPVPSESSDSVAAEPPPVVPAIQVDVQVGRPAARSQPALSPNLRWKSAWLLAGGGSALVLLAVLLITFALGRRGGNDDSNKSDSGVASARGERTGSKIDKSAGEKSETNKVPVLSVIEIPSQTMEQGRRLQVAVQLMAQEADRFGDSLRFRLEGTPLPGARIDPGLGLFTWDIPQDQEPKDYAIRVGVALADRPAVSTSVEFTVTVEAAAPTLAPAPFDDRTAKEYQKRWANYVQLPVVRTNSIGMKLVLIPPGEFKMGSSAEHIAQFLTEAKQQNAPSWHSVHILAEKPAHRVRITRPFYLGVYEVTQAEYEALMGNNPSHSKGDPNRPVENLTSQDAQQFCRKLSELPREKSAGAVYRLPTEAEWEYACRAGTTTRYSFGEDTTVLGQYAWGRSNSQEGTQPVGRLRPNAWGLYDMHGNVWEWCADWYASDYYAMSPTDDPVGPSPGTSRLLRGGSWIPDQPGFFRSAYRLYFHSADGRLPDSGFRVARTLAP